MVRVNITQPQDAPLGARSLFHMSMSTLRRHSHLLWETNDTPLHILLPICRTIENPEQLGAIEASSPHLAGHMGDIWLKLMKQNIAGWDKFLLRDKKHSDGRPWTEDEARQKATYKTYLSTLKKAKAAERESDALLRQAIQARAEDQRSRETRIVERLPVVRTNRRMAGGEKYDGLSRNAANGAMTFAGGSKTKTNSARGVMNKIQRELKEQRLMKAGGSLSTPSHLLTQKAEFLPQGADRRAGNEKAPLIIRRPGRPISTLRSPATAYPAPISISTTPARRPATTVDKTVEGTPPASKRTSTQAGLEEKNTPPTRLRTTPLPRPQQRKKAEATYLVPSRRKR